MTKARWVWRSLRRPGLRCLFQSLRWSVRHCLLCMWSPEGELQSTSWHFCLCCHPAAPVSGLIKEGRANAAIELIQTRSVLTDLTVLIWVFKSYQVHALQVCSHDSSDSQGDSLTLLTLDSVRNKWCEPCQQSGCFSHTAETSPSDKTVFMSQMSVLHYIVLIRLYRKHNLDYLYLVPWIKMLKSSIYAIVLNAAIWCKTKLQKI